MSSTLAAANPISANVSSAASSSRSTVSLRRRLGRCISRAAVTMHDCIRYASASNAPLRLSARNLRPSAPEGGGDHGAGLLLHPGEVLLPVEGLGVDLVD